MIKINLAILLAKKKWKLSDLQRITGLRYMTLNDLYHEMSLSIKLDYIDKICEALGCTSGELIEYVPDKK